MQRFKLLFGDHICEQGTFGPGSIIESAQDLRRLNGGGGMTPKFELVEDNASANENVLLRERIAELEAQLKEVAA